MPVELSLWIADGTASVPLGLCPDAPDETPPPLARIKAAISDNLVRIDDRMIELVVGAFDLPRDAESTLGSPVEVWQFLRQHAGERAYLDGAESPPATTATDAEVDAPPITGGGGRVTATDGELGESADAANSVLGESADSVNSVLGEPAAVTDAEVGEPPSAGQPWQTAAGVTAWRARSAPYAPERASERSGGRGIRQMLTLIARALP